MLGYPAQTLKRVDEVVTLARRINHPYIEGFARLFGCLMRILRREPPECQREAETLISLSTEHEFPDWLNWATAAAGWALEQQGNRDGLDRLVHGMVELRAARAELMLPFFGSCAPKSTCGVMRQKRRVWRSTEVWRLQYGIERAHGTRNFIDYWVISRSRNQVMQPNRRAPPKRTIRRRSNSRSNNKRNPGNSARP